MRNMKSLLVILTLLVLGASARGDDGDAILGAWHTTSNRSVVRLFKRGDHYFGQIISLSAPNWPADDKLGMGGKAKTDRNNPQKELRGRTIAGVEFMSNFVYSGKQLWEDGKIYDPEVGKTYKCKMTLVATNRLEVRGFIGISLLGRTATWTR